MASISPAWPVFYW